MSTRKQKPVGSGYVSLLMLVVALMFLEIPTAMTQTADEEKYSLSISVFVTGRDSNTRVDAAGGPGGTVVDLEDDFGLEMSDSVFRVDGYVRFAKKDRFDS